LTGSARTRKFRQWIRRVRRPSFPDLFRRSAPLSDAWGYDRGTPIDRYYVESFLKKHGRDITGRTLEVAETEYTRRFGVGVTHMDALDSDPSGVEVTIHADLSIREQIPECAFDCFICTQTLHLIYDIRSAVENAHRLLKPGGVLLATLPCMARIDPAEKEEFWRVTHDSCARLFTEIFGAQNVTVESYGSLATCISFLQGRSAEEMSQKRLDEFDEAFPLTVCVRAFKAL